MHYPYEFNPDFTCLTDDDYNDFMNNPTASQGYKDEVNEIINTKVYYLGDDDYKFVLKNFEIHYNLSWRRLKYIKDLSNGKEYSCSISCYYKSDSGANLEVELFSDYPNLMMFNSGNIQSPIYYFDNQFFVPFIPGIYKKIEVVNMVEQAPVSVSVSRFYNGNYKQAVALSINSITYLIVFNDALTKLFSVCVLENSESKEFEYYLRGKTTLLNDKLTNPDYVISYDNRELIVRFDIWRYEEISDEEAERLKLSRNFHHIDLPKISFRDSDGTMYDIHQVRDYNRFEVRGEMKNKISIDHTERRPARY